MGIKIFRKNRFDFDYNNIVITPTDLTATNDGAAFTDFLRNRNNTSGWATTGSNDAANTVLVLDTTTNFDIDSLILSKHNFKNYTIKYWNGSSYVDFSTPVAVTNNTLTTTSHSFTKVSISRVKLTITGTMVANADKTLAQFIMTELLGEFACQPEIQPTIDKTRKVTKYLSGRSFIARSISSFDCRIRKSGVVSDSDLSLVETIYESFEGVLVWLCGGTTTQYLNSRFGYRLEDIYLMLPTAEYLPAWDDGYYANGMSIDLRLTEIV